ncbi:aminopeptidase N [Streptomyces monashensis]|uniref:Aminopeptidase N n=1 Tax=Streptomyces monashensis TaxID=1678012 RepID=A0A1S2PJ44_9ACTN|nr:aminopeptidase N [Streptomyces monashensis]OIJ93600.1 aminopeptidase N [Streptomyces monashensis]
MRVAEITRAETVERARLLRVDTYHVSLDLTQGERTFRSTSVIRFSCAEPAVETHADLIADTVHEILLNGRPIDPATAYRDGRITLRGLAAENELRVTASCAYGADGGGLSRFTDSADGHVYTYTNFEPADARRVYADFEQPDLKAVFHLSVTAPAHWTVLSNMPSPKRLPVGSQDAATWTFPPTPRLSTYLACLCAGEYTVVHDSHTTARGQVIQLELGVRASLAAHLEPEDMFGITKQGLDYFTELFDSDLPFPKYGQIFVPECRSGAMENPGLVTFSEQLLFRSKATTAKYELRAMIVMHEMAHMWFGDHVTMQWWGDLWLNESFAEFCGSLASAEATRFSEAWTTFANGRKTWGYAQDQLPSTHPIAAEVGTLSEAIANFDGISYAKGAAVLKALVAYVGRERFFAGVRAYFADYAGGNASLSDLLAKLEQASGKDLSDWSKAWLETAGVSTLSSAFELDEGGAYTEFTVLQSAPETHPHLRPHHIAVGLYNLVNDALVRTRRLEVEVIGARTPVPELVGVRQPDLVLLNDDDLTFALIEFDPHSLVTLRESIGTFADSLARAISWGAVVDMTVHAKISVPTFVRMLTRGMGTEDSIAVLQSLHQTATYVIRTLADPAWVPVGKSELAESALELLHDAEPGGDLQLSWAQLLARTATTSRQLDYLSALLSGTKTVAGLTVDTDLRWMLLRRLAATGRAGDPEIDAELECDPTDQGRNEARGARAAIPDIAHKTEAWRLLTETELGTEAVLAVANGFGLAEHAELTSGFAEAYFQVLPTLWAERPEKMRALLADRIFPYNAASPRLLEHLDAFAIDHDSDPALRRFLAEARDFVERILKSRALVIPGS